MVIKLSFVAVFPSAFYLLDERSNKCLESYNICSKFPAYKIMYIVLRYLFHMIFSKKVYAGRGKIRTH